MFSNQTAHAPYTNQNEFHQDQSISAPPRQRQPSLHNTVLMNQAHHLQRSLSVPASSPTPPTPFQTYTSSTHPAILVTPNNLPVWKGTNTSIYAAYPSLDAIGNIVPGAVKDMAEAERKALGEVLRWLGNELRTRGPEKGDALVLQYGLRQQQLQFQQQQQHVYSQQNQLNHHHAPVVQSSPIPVYYTHDENVKVGTQDVDMTDAGPENEYEVPMSHHVYHAAPAQAPRPPTQLANNTPRETSTQALLRVMHPHFVEPDYSRDFPELREAGSVERVAKMVEGLLKVNEEAMLENMWRDCVDA